MGSSVIRVICKWQTGKRSRKGFCKAHGTVQNRSGLTAARKGLGKRNPLSALPQRLIGFSLTQCSLNVLWELGVAEQAVKQIVAHKVCCIGASMTCTCHREMSPASNKAVCFVAAKLLTRLCIYCITLARVLFANTALLVKCMSMCQGTLTGGLVRGKLED